MKSRSYPPGVAAHIVQAGQGKVRTERNYNATRDRTYERRIVPNCNCQRWSHPRLLALLDGALDEEQRILERWGRPYTITGKLRKLWKSKEFHTWNKLTTSQVALWLSGFVKPEAHGGSRKAGYCYSLSFESEAEFWNVSRRMLFMALKLRKSGNAILIRAIAEGGVSLGDAIAHLDHDKGELRKAIRMVEQRKARSLRQALAA